MCVTITNPMAITGSIYTHVLHLVAIGGNHYMYMYGYVLFNLSFLLSGPPPLSLDLCRPKHPPIMSFRETAGVSCQTHYQEVPPHRHQGTSYM